MTLVQALRAIRDGMLWLVPYLLVSSTLLLIAYFLQFIDTAPLISQAFFTLYDQLADMLPFCIAGSVGYMVAIEYRLIRAPVVFLCIGYAFMGVVALTQHSDEALVFTTALSLIIPLFVVPFLAKIKQYSWTRLVHQDIGGYSVNESLNVILPGIITALVLWFFLKIFVALLPDSALIEELLFTDYSGSESYIAIKYTFLNSFFWFFGIHGSQILTPMLEAINQASLLEQGVGEVKVVNEAFLGSYVFIGGSGATLSLIMAILLKSSSRRVRFIAVASVPMALINVNELLLFTLPIVFNPRIFIPFISVPIVNVVISLFAFKLGLLSVSNLVVPFTTPALVNAFIIDGGSGILLQVALIIIGALIYGPFVKDIDKQAGQVADIYLRSLETVYSQRQDEASLLLQSPVEDAIVARNKRQITYSHILSLAEQEFFLEYQPQIDRKTGLITGCEPLIRSMGFNGKVYMPAEFLGWLQEAGLMKDVDLWVTRHVIKQLKAWRGQGFSIPVSINITRDSLSDPDAIDRIIALCADIETPIALEITEESLSGHIDTIKNNISKLHSAGISIYIDDFGTGFSSISCLNQFEIDAIKIDRSFVVALNNIKGQRVFSGILNLADQLGLKVIVEGVETLEQLSFIPSTIDVSIQGWLYSSSVSAEELPRFCRSSRRS